MADVESTLAGANLQQPPPTTISIPLHIGDNAVSAILQSAGVGSTGQQQQNTSSMVVASTSNSSSSSAAELMMQQQQQQSSQSGEPPSKKQMLEHASTSAGGSSTGSSGLSQGIVHEKLEYRLGGILCCAVCLDLPKTAMYQVRVFELV